LLIGFDRRSIENLGKILPLFSIVLVGVDGAFALAKAAALELRESRPSVDRLVQI
jgi:hypothetical protein